MVKKNFKNHFYNYILAKKDTKKKESGKKEKKGKLGLRFQTFFLENRPPSFAILSQLSVCGKKRSKQRTYKHCCNLLKTAYTVRT